MSALGSQERLAAAALSGICATFLLGGLRTGRVVGPGFLADATRTDNPRGYWTAVAVWGLLCLATAPLVFSA